MAKRRRQSSEQPWSEAAWLGLGYALCLGLAPGISAQETNAPSLADLKAMDLEQLLQVKVVTVYAASRFEQTITEAPSSITVVPSDEIKRYGYRTLADVLRGQQGFHVSYDRNYAFLGPEESIWATSTAAYCCW